MGEMQISQHGVAWKGTWRSPHSNPLAWAGNLPPASDCKGMEGMKRGFKTFTGKGVGVKEGSVQRDRGRLGFLCANDGKHLRRIHSRDGTG